MAERVPELEHTSRHTPPSLEEREKSPDSETYLAEITKSLVSMAQLDFTSVPEIRGSGPLDAVATGLRALAEELEATVVAKNNAENANQSKADFLANMSHELRTPLAVIMGSVELLSTTHLNPEQVKLANQIQHATSMLYRLVSDILDFSKLDAGTLRLQQGRFDVPSLMKAATAQHAANAQKKGLSLLLHPLNLPARQVLGDDSRLLQIIHNLLSNAIKFTSSGTVRLGAHGTIQGNMTHIVFEVEDSGIGIRKADQERLFERFHLFNTALHRPHSGAGLGLSITHSLVQSMNGTIEVQSTPGIGSKFAVRLSLPVDEQTECSAEILVGSPLRKRLLVVDDNDMMREVTGEMLRALGCEVELAESGQRCLEILAHTNFDLILMDWQMPYMDGLETTRQILRLQREHQSPIVAVTAHGSSDDAIASLKVGMVAHMTKPITLTSLRQTIEQYAI